MGLLVAINEGQLKDLYQPISEAVFLLKING